MRPFGHLVPLDVARRQVLAAARPVRAVEAVPLATALGRVASRPYRAPRPVPPFARATWDGYALRAAATRRTSPRAPVRLPVVGEVFAERRYDGAVGSREAVAIATGAPLPRGADTVVPFERVREGPGWIEVGERLTAGDRIADPGDDFPRGARLAEAGARLAPASLGALAAAGFDRVEVYRRPVVAIVPNGNELTPPGTRPAPGQIFESNNATLAAVIAGMGGVPRPFPPVPDDPRRIEGALRRALAASDLVLATGGSSVGEHDFLPAIFPRLGRLLFHGIAVRPGKPTLAAVADGKLLLGLPGHPTSCLSNAYWLLLPVLQRLGHRPGPGWTEVDVRLAQPIGAPSPGLSTIVPLHLRDGRAEPTFRDSSAITSLEGADAFAVLPPAARSLPRGARVRAFRLPAALTGGAP